MTSHDVTVTSLLGWVCPLAINNLDSGTKFLEAKSSDAKSSERKEMLLRQSIVNEKALLAAYSISPHVTVTDKVIYFNLFHRINPSPS